MSSSVKSDIISPGTIIKKRWRVLEKIGGGGFGEIYEATDLISSQKVAVKLESVSQQKQVLKMEVTVLRKLQNKPNICKFFGCGRDELYTFVVMSLQVSCTVNLLCLFFKMFLFYLNFQFFLMQIFRILLFLTKHFQCK